jgi:hypothetical protein
VNRDFHIDFPGDTLYFSLLTFNRKSYRRQKLRRIFNSNSPIRSCPISVGISNRAVHESAGPDFIVRAINSESCSVAIEKTIVFATGEHLDAQNSFTIRIRIMAGIKKIAWGIEKR